MLAEAAAAAAKAAEAQPSQGQKIWRDELEAEEASLLQKFTRMNATIRKIQDQKKKDEARLRKIRGQLATIPNGDRAAGFCRTLDEEHAHNESNSLPVLTTPFSPPLPFLTIPSLSRRISLFSAPISSLHSLFLSPPVFLTAPPCYHPPFPFVATFQRHPHTTVPWPFANRMLINPNLLGQW